MNKRGITLIFSVGVIVLFAFSASAANGSGLLPACINSLGGCTLCDVWPLANKIINFLLFDIAVPLLTVVLIWGGVLWTAGGSSPSNIEQGKKIITSGFIGILIAFAGWLIVDTVIKSLASGGSVVIAWQSFPKEGSCQNPNLANEKFNFQDIIPGASPDGTPTSPTGGETQEETIRNRLFSESNGDIQVNKGKCNPYDQNFTLVAGGCTNVGGLKEATIQEIIRIQKETGATVYITGGSEIGHSCNAGAPSHCSGNKVDFRIGIPEMDNYIKTVFETLCDPSIQCLAAVKRSDVTAAYRRPSTGIIYYQEGDHWDVLVP